LFTNDRIESAQRRLFFHHSDTGSFLYTECRLAAFVVW
jgi:hypothetical protein